MNNYKVVIYLTQRYSFYFRKLKSAFGGAQQPSEPPRREPIQLPKSQPEPEPEPEPAYAPQSPAYEPQSPSYEPQVCRPLLFIRLHMQVFRDFASSPQ